MRPVDLGNYRDFVLDVTSEVSLWQADFKDRLDQLQYESPYEINWPELITAAIGIQAETGEFSEVVKKCIFQGKEMNEDARFHAMRELGDVICVVRTFLVSINILTCVVIVVNVVHNW